MTELDRSERTRYDLGLLFTDGLPQHDDATGYRGAVAARAAGISYRQLDYWARTSLVVAVDREEPIGPAEDVSG